MGKFYFLERLKRAALLVLLLCVVGLGESLAQTRIATLQHGEEITAFYGVNAFVEAHEAAVSGDIITLSSGPFSCSDFTITKAITLRGAGCSEDTVAGTLPTEIVDWIVADVMDDTLCLTIEGIRFNSSFEFKNLSNPKFYKCDFGSFYSYSYHESEAEGIMQNALFVNCKINDFGARFAINTSLMNSVVQLNSSVNDGYTVTCVNSIVGCSDVIDSGLNVYNSIVIRAGRCQDNCGVGCSFFNCVALNCGCGSSGYSLIGSSYLENSIQVENGPATVFVDWVFGQYGYFSSSIPLNDFVVKEEVAQQFFNALGTQVGIYAGFAPFSRIPSYMVRTQVNVADQSTNDGKLDVQVEIINDGE